MAYNNFYTGGYQPYYPQPNNMINTPYPSQINTPYQSNQNNQQARRPEDAFIWVQGEAAAKSFMVAPNTTVTLWDSEAPVIYIKSADASGVPSMQILDYTHRNAQNNQILPPKTGYATKDDLDAVEKRLNERLDEIMKEDK